MDSLFPLLIYTVIFSNVDFLKKNLDFILKFGNQNNSNGEVFFIIQTFIAVLKFIDNLDIEEVKRGQLLIKKHE